MAAIGGGGTTANTGTAPVAPAAPNTYPSLGSVALTAPKLVAAGAPQPSALSLAQQQAQQSVAATILAIHQQQNADNAAAARQAAQIGAAAQATYGALSGLPGQTSQAYQDAVDQTQQLGQGFTGQLATDAAGQAASVAGTLGHLGAPTHVVSQGPSLANFVYGTGAYLPGEALRNEGVAAAAGAQAVPAAALAQGRTDALGVIGAGRDQAATLDAQLATARGSFPTLTNTYLNSLLNQQSKVAAINLAQQKQTLAVQHERVGEQLAVAKARADATYKNDYLAHLQAGDSERVAHDKALETATAQYHAQTAAISQYNANTSRINSATSQANAATSRINARTSASRAQIDAAKAQAAAAPRYNATTSRSLGVRSDQYGNPILGASGKPILLPGFSAGPNGQVVKTSSSTTARQLTPEQTQRYTGEITDTVTFLQSGVPSTTSKSGVVTPGKPALSYTDALRYMRQHGYMATPQLTELTLAALGQVYPGYEIGIARGRVAGPAIPSATAPPGV